MSKDHEQAPQSPSSKKRRKERKKTFSHSFHVQRTSSSLVLGKRKKKYNNNVMIRYVAGRREAHEVRPRLRLMSRRRSSGLPIALLPVTKQPALLCGDKGS
mmetsp:Transcript_38715/g.67094  ORF Transcript_38715/g.67094 Transcript_38715/m.67094 type:complete len:101 (-) Transcript_38715:272-574(-)